MLRRLFTIASVVSLLVFVATVGLWVRSYWQLDTLYYVGHNWASVSVSSKWGAVTFGTRRIAGLGDPEHAWHFHSGRADRLSFGIPHYSLFGFSTSGFADKVQTAFGAYQYEDKYLTVPFWFILVCPAVLPVFYVLVDRRHHRRNWPLSCNRCPSCGYNLTGNTSGVCPECGTPVPRSPKTIA